MEASEEQKAEFAEWPDLVRDARISSQADKCGCAAGR